MRLHRLLPCMLALGLAGLLLAPPPRGAAFSVIGGFLSLDERDVRVFNNFADPAANQNQTTHPQFPGGLGAPLALWKGAVEWGSRAHGDGSGDPTQPILGSGGANFDAAWAGEATGPGNLNENTVSAIAACTPGIVAFTETPIIDGWRMRFCDDAFEFADGPGAIPAGTYDLQGVMTHEYGHALGLGHSAAPGATMAPSGSPGSLSERSLDPDDIAGVRSLYGEADPSKPVIDSIDVSGGGTQMTINGSNLGLTNAQVWFTSAAPTDPGADPLVQVTGLSSTNGRTRLDLAIPAGAGPGDVLVRNQGAASVFSNLSNAFPSDLQDTGGSAGFRLTALIPDTVEALVPGTAQFLTLTGDELSGVTGITLEPDVPVPAGSYTIVDDRTITLDLPQAAALGPTQLSVHTATETRSIGITVVAPASPKLQLADGENTTVATNGERFPVIMAGVPGTLHQIVYSTSSTPSVASIATLQLGNGFSQLFLGPVRTIPASGYARFGVEVTGQETLGTFYVQSADLTTPPAPQIPVSNLQVIGLGP